jgi:hypothetical protein
MDDFYFDDEERPVEEGRKKIELTVNQKRKIQDTLKQMDKNLVQPQHSVGRTYIGPGFASKPEKIVYKDFEVGKPMSITIELTNKSYSFNSFKLLPLDDEILDFFEIDYKPSGRLPAGISTTMTLKFTPMTEDDYFSNLKLLSETGMVLIPIECISKKCIIEIDNPVIDFGDVILGEEVHKTLNLENKGALSSRFIFQDGYGQQFKEIKEPIDTAVDEEDETTTGKNFNDFVERTIIVEKDSFKNNPDISTSFYFQKQLAFPYSGSINPYSKKHIPLVLNCLYIGNYIVELKMKVESKREVDYKTITIKFNIINLPVCAESKIYNLNYLIEENTFREKITLHNSANMSYKLQICNHKDTNDFLEINPTLGYIQPNSKFEMWVKIKTLKSLEKLHKFFKSGNEFNIPLKVVINNIKIPIIIILNFHTTTDMLELSQSFLNFDKVYSDESNKLRLKLANRSELPQKYGFILLPPQISVKENIETILPGETTAVDVRYETKDYLGHREGDIVNSK